MKENTNLFNTISFWIIVATVFLLPLFFLPLTIISLYQAKISLFAILVITVSVLFLIERIRQGDVSIPFRLGYALLAVIPIFYLISGAFGLEPYKSIVGGLHEQDTFLMFALLMIFAFLVSKYVRTPIRIGYVLVALFGSVLISILFQITRIVAGESLSFGVFTSGASTLVGSWNELTILAVIILGISLILLETVKLTRLARTLLMITLILPFFFFTLSSLTFDLYIISLSLPVVIGVVALVVFSYVFSIRRSIKPKGADTGALPKGLISLPSLIVLVISIALVIFGSSVSRLVTEATKVVYTEARPTWQSTAVVAKNVLAESPILGTGPNTFAYGWDKYKPIGVNSYPFWNTSFSYGVGMIPSSIVTVGIIGLLLWIAFYVFVMSLVWRVLFSMKKIEDTFPLKLIVAFGTLFTTFVLFFYTPGVVVVVIHFLFLGLLFAQDVASGGEKTVSFHNKQWQSFISIILFVLIIVGLVYCGYRIVQKNVATYYANSAIKQGANPSKALEHISMALALDPSQAMYSEIAAQIFAGRVAELASLPKAEAEARADEIRASIVSSVNYANNAEKLSPNDYSIKIANGRIYQFFGSLGIAGANQEATAKFMGAASSSPANPLPYILASYTELSSSNYEQSKQYIINALQLKSDYSDVPDLGEGVRLIIENLNKANSKNLVAPEDASTSTDEDVASATATKSKAQK